MTSVLDLDKLPPEQRRLHTLDNIVFGRHKVLKQSAEKIHEILTFQRFDYSLEEIQTSIEREKTK